LLHHYWLDEGTTVFDQIADPSKREARLLDYDMRPFLSVRPTARTAAVLSGLQCLFRETALGCVVLAPATGVIPADMVFDFIVAARQSSVHNYTALTLRPQRIHDLYNATDGITYRYKENVPVLSNLTGTKRGTAPDQSLFLSREIPPLGADDQVEALVLSGNALLQLTSDGPSATTQQLNATATELPVYLHQADSPAIVAPAGLSGVPAHGVRLSGDVTDDVFALISLTAVRAGDTAFIFVDGTGVAKDAAPVFQVRFKNRSTIWNYLDKRTGAVVESEAIPLPLTYFGNAGTKQKPSEGLVKAEKTGGKITRLVSEIYV
jgi:hypothetical protein